MAHALYRICARRGRCPMGWDIYGFAPRRVALLLLGGTKVGDDRWYERFVARADALFEAHLKDLKGLRGRSWRDSLLSSERRYLHRISGGARSRRLRC